MRVLFLNQYFPPDPAPTGMLLRELADALEAAGHVVDFVDAGEAYRVRPQKRGRLRREMKALLRLLFHGVRRPRADVVFSASSPACLLVVATLVALCHRARSLHWIMDLYPEIAVALREFRPGLIPTVISSLMKWCYRRTDCVIALDEDMALQLRSYRVECEVVRPWVLAPVLKHVTAISQTPRAEEWTWIYSGNLGRAHDWETLLEVQVILEARNGGCRLLFQGGGPSWPAAQARATELGLRNCTWSGYVEEAELPKSLLACHLLVATQLPAAQGLLWPSKLALAMSLPRPLLWIGPKNGAVADLLRTLPHAGIFSAGETTRIADWIVALKQGAANIEAGDTFNAEHHRALSLQILKNLVLNLDRANSTRTVP